MNGTLPRQVMLMNIIIIYVTVSGPFYKTITDAMRNISCRYFMEGRPLMFYLCS